MGRSEMRLNAENIARDHDGNAEPKKHKVDSKAEIQKRTGAVGTKSNPK
jgi:hypothetical protein